MHENRNLGYDSLFLMVKQRAAVKAVSKNKLIHGGLIFDGIFTLIPFSKND